LVCNCIFYLINWFIELINAFSGKIFDDQFQLGDKLINRLSDICQLRSVLKNILSLMKFYRPPMVVFGLIDSSVDELPFVQQFVKENKPKSGKKKGFKETKKAVKKPKTENLFDNSDLEEEKSIIDDSEDDQESTSEFDLNKISIYFREFDLSLINFVNFNLNLNANVIPDTIEKEPALPSLKPEHLLYVISDFNSKLSTILKSNSAKTNPLGLTAKPTKLQLFLQSNPVDVTGLINNLIDKNMPALIQHLDTIQNHIRTIQDAHDGIKDPSEISTSENNLFLLKILNQILKMLQQTFSYLNSVNNQSKLEDLFKVFIKSVKIQSSSKLASQIDKLPDLVCFNYLAKFKDVLLDLNSGHTLVQLLDLIIKILSKKTDGSLLAKMKKILCTCSLEFLTSDYNPKLNLVLSNRQMNNDGVVCCLNYLISNSENSLSVVEDLVKVICNDDFMLDRQNCDKYSTLKSHFLSYYRTCLEFTVNELKVCSGDTLEVFSKIRSLTHMHCELVLLKKSVAFKDINMLTVIKNSKIFVTNFTKYSMPCLDKAFDGSKQEIVVLLQKIQKCVHFIQEILVTKDQAAIAKQAPIYNRVIEALMVRVQQLLYVNSFDGGFMVNFVESRLKIGDDGRRKKEKKPLKKKKGKNNGSDIEESEIEEDEE
ncbi:Fanconi anemia group D2, partial [Brachionus plicatilis]